MKQDILSRYGGDFICETARGGGEALGGIEEREGEGVEIGLVITDWLMPGMKGDELLRRVREKCPDAGLMVVSGQADGQAVKLKRESFDRFSYIEKPWRAKRLFAEIDRLLDGEAAARD